MTRIHNDELNNPINFVGFSSTKFFSLHYNKCFQINRKKFNHNSHIQPNFSPHYKPFGPVAPGIPGGPRAPFSAKHFGIQFPPEPVQFFRCAIGDSTIENAGGTFKTGCSSSLRGHNPLVPAPDDCDCASFQNCYSIAKRKTRTHPYEKKKHLNFYSNSFHFISLFFRLNFIFYLPLEFL